MLAFLPAFCAGILAAGEVAPVDLASGRVLIARSAGISADTRAPLVICLHGTDDRAEDALEFWAAMDWGMGCTFVAPQGRYAGWRESDLPALREMLAYLKEHVAFDPGRVLLAGHSAGGAMAFHLLYAEQFPATAVVVTANYLPPNTTLEQVRARADVPVFYAVGVHDLNHERMRDGVGLLRGAGVRVTMQRPQIGHVQDRRVGQEAVKWFEGLCREAVQASIDRARNAAARGAAAGTILSGLEQITGHAAGHFSDQVRAAQELARELEQAGVSRLERADKLVRSQRFAEARSEYLAVEQIYQPASLAGRARAARLRLESRPEAAVTPGALREGEEAGASKLWSLIEQAVEAADQRQAAEYCRELLNRYPRSEWADEAATLLRSLQESTR